MAAIYGKTVQWAAGGMVWLRWPRYFWARWRQPHVSIVGAEAYASRRCLSEWWGTVRGPLWVRWEDLAR